MKSRTLHLLLGLFCFTLPLSQVLNSRLLLTITLVSFFLSNQKFSFRDFLVQSWDLLLFFFTLVIGLTYTNDMELGLRQLETNLSLIGVPIILYNQSEASKEKITNMFYLFALGALCAGLICTFNAFVSFLKYRSYSVFFYQQFTQIIDSHPTYFAYHLIFIITYGLYILYYELPSRFIGLTIAIISLFFLLLLLTGGQTTFISLLLVFSFFISKYILEKKTKREFVTVTFTVTLMLCLVSAIIVVQNSEGFQSIGNQNDYWERMALWESAIKATTNVVTGVGTGDYNLVLNEYYRSHGLAHFASENFNSHNQFIQLYFSNGVIGLTVLFILLGRPLYLSVTRQDLLGVLLFFPFLLYGVTEVFLGRYQGVVFFAFLHQILILHFAQAKPMTPALKVKKL